MARQAKDPEFPCSLIVSTPFPTYRLAEAALRALQVDEELSPLVRRSFTLVVPGQKKRPTIVAADTAAVNLGSGDAGAGVGADAAAAAGTTGNDTEPIAHHHHHPPHHHHHNQHQHQQHQHQRQPNSSETAKTVLRTEYKAKTNRMLRVAVNGFMESLGVVLGVMEKLDVDVLAKRNEAAAAATAAAKS